MNTEITPYYNSLAPRYDADRFGNTYGQFIDYQERIVLDKHLSAIPKRDIWDIACGTGRLMNYCGIGIDISAGMLSEAKQKHPNKTYFEGNILETALPLAAPKAAICFHLIMHLEQTDLPMLLGRMHQFLDDKGLFIFDIPAAERKWLHRKQSTQWHGNNAYSDSRVLDMIQGNWDLVDSVGVLFLPIHRFPKNIRRFFLPLETWLNRTGLKKWASYRIYILQKK